MYALHHQIIHVIGLCARFVCGFIVLTCATHLNVCRYCILGLCLWHTSYGVILWTLFVSAWLRR
jgi:hypothetical protein